MPYKILIADDQKDNIVAIYSILNHFDKGLEIIGAPNGKVAFDLAKTKNPDLIILDWEMPVMTGLDAVKFLKSTPETKEIPIIMATALTSSENLQEAMEAGAMDYIKKPIDRLELLARVKSALSLYDSYREIKKQKNTIQVQADELKTKNEELKKLSIVASKTENSVIIMNSIGEFEWANDGFRKIYGYALEEYKLKFGKSIFETSKSPNVEKVITDCIHEKKSDSYISQFTTPKNKIKWIQTTLTPIVNEDFEIEKLIAVESDITTIKEQEEQIILEKKKSDELLLNILPNETAEELKLKGSATPRHYKSVSIMFTDFKGFTNTCSGLAPNEIVSELHSYFVQFDDIIQKNYLEKIKTIGDAYMAAGGLPIRNKTNPIDCVLAGLEIQNLMAEIGEQKRKKKMPVWELRLGIHTGEVVSGVVGKKKFAYDIWGDSVNIASRMETAGEVGKVNISETTYHLVKDYFMCETRGKIEAKNKGKVEMYFVNAIIPELSENGEGKIPNEKFKKILSVL
ncbi:MAG: hypothetical protein A2046_11010 [Bacteroidetes bacterium GWA2_30_7]|nr:MAG: hypothetical protein A2046_11010 [Bacteroidetes bacterium GWA2_30_7]